LEEAAPLATDLTASDLGLQTSFTASGTPLAVESSATTDAVQPFTVALPLPEGASLVEESYANLVVVFKYLVASTGKYVTGLILRKDLVIANGLVSFSTRHFGVYQTVLTGDQVKEFVAVEGEAAPLTRREVESLPALVWTEVGAAPVV